MTNKEVAEHFASLPPDAPAGIVVANLDTGFASDEQLVKFSEVKGEIEDEQDEFDDDTPTAWQKW